VLLREDDLPVHHFPPETNPFSVELDSTIKGFDLLDGIGESELGTSEELSSQRLNFPDQVRSRQQTSSSVTFVLGGDHGSFQTSHFLL
jgi:hypothetical protein